MNKQLYNVFSINYESSATASFLVFTINEQEQITNYQVEMISRNETLKILPFSINRFDDKININYDITSKMPLSHCLKRKGLERAEFIDMLSGITGAIISSRKLLLNHNNFLIDENYIYVNPGTMEVALVYLPFELGIDIDTVFKEFILNLIISAVHSEEQGGDNYIQRILNCIRQEFFKVIELDKLLRELKGSDRIALYEDVRINLGTHNRDENIIKYNVNKLLDKEEAKMSKREFDVRTTKISTIKLKNRYKRSNIIIALLFQILFLSLGILTYQLFPSTGQNQDDFTMVSGIVLILGAIDFLVLRKVLVKTNIDEEVIKDKNTINIEKVTSTREKSIYEPYLHKAKDNETSNDSQNISTYEKLSNNIDTVVISKMDSPVVPYLKRLLEGVEERIILSKPNFIIGRLRGQVDYVVQNNAIGRVHVEIITREDKYYIKDLNSRNGTKINYTKICGNVEHEIFNRDIILLADFEYEFITE